jgi:hypothetical protein
MRLRKKHSNRQAKLLKFGFGEVLPKNSPKGVPSQNTPFYNSLMIQPIHTNSNSIDEVRQVEHQTKLKQVNRFYSVSFSRSQIQFVFTDYLKVGILTWNSRALTIEDNLHHHPIPLPKFLVIPFWQTRRIKPLVSQNCQVTFFVVHTHSLERLSPPDRTDSLASRTNVV